MRRLKLVFLAQFVMLASCNTARGPDPSVAAFDPSQASYVRAPGKGVITGEAFLRDRSGHTNVRYAAGETVRLIPATTYAQSRMQKLFGSVKFMPATSAPQVETDTQYASLTRTTTTGSKGKFKFENVAPGRYYLTTQLVWTPKNSFLPQGGAMYEEVTLTGKESGPVEVILSGN